MDMYEAPTAEENHAFVNGHPVDQAGGQAKHPTSESVSAGESNLDTPLDTPTETVVNTAAEASVNVVNDDVADAAFSASAAQTHREKATIEELVVTGDNLFNKVKELIQQGGIRRIVIKTKRDKTLLEIPLTVGLVGGVLGVGVFPVMAAVTMLGAMLAQLKLVVERRPEAHS